MTLLKKKLNVLLNQILLVNKGKQHYSKANNLKNRRSENANQKLKMILSNGKLQEVSKSNYVEKTMFKKRKIIML